MKKQLIACIESNNIVSIYCDINRPNTHLTGFIDNYSEEALVVRHISKEGHYDGFIMVDPCDIYRVDYNSEYEKKVGALYLHKGQSHPNLPNGDDVFESLLCFCMNTGCVISIELPECIISGLPIYYSENTMHLSVLDSYGRKNGETLVAFSAIRSFAADTSAERDIAILYGEKSR